MQEPAGTQDAPLRFLASFDIEDWFHAENVKASLPTDDWSQLEPRIEANTHRLLDILAETQARSTCFVLGWVAQTYPSLVRRIVDEGHEVASHTHLHKRLNLLSRDEVVRDLAEAKDALEQVAGSRVLGVRAPNFSISDEVLDCLAEAGYWYDSSYFAFAQHDRYGKLAAPVPDEPVVEIRPGLLELQMVRVKVGPIDVPWSGGAYFRLIPFEVYRRGVSRRLDAHRWFTFYFHPWELDPEERAPDGMAASLRFRAYTGRRRMARDLPRLLRTFGSSRIDEALRAGGYAPPSG
jgi:polysaccharide deacetylase family protein (PEP-CTERM system associated)